MNKIFSTITLSLLSLAVQAQVNFQDLSLDAALAKAQKEGKYVFLDCYTSWCVPCKYMANSVFTMKEAGDVINPRFVSIKMDMEKGVGKDVADKYDIKAFPTFLLIAPDGKEWHRIVGRKTVEELRQGIERGLNSATSLTHLNDRMKKGEKLPMDALVAYKLALQDAYYQDELKEVEQLIFATQTDEQKLTKDFWPEISSLRHSPLGSDNYQFIINHLDEYISLVGNDAVEHYIYQVCDDAIGMYYFVGYGGITKDPKAFSLCREAMAKHQFSFNDVITKKIELAEKVEAKDYSAIETLVDEITDRIPKYDGGNYLGTLSLLKDKFPSEKKYELFEADKYEAYLLKVPVANRPNWVEHNMAINRKRGNIGVYFENYDFEKALYIGDSRWECPVFVWLYDAKDKQTKKLDKIFANEAVGDAAHPVCVKYSLDSEDGKKVSQKYHATEKQTLLILDCKGNEKARLTGKQTAESIIAFFNNNKRQVK